MGMVVLRGRAVGVMGVTVCADGVLGVLLLFLFDGVDFSSLAF